MKELIYGITTLKWDILKSNPPKLLISASGLTRTSGWTSPILIPLFQPGVTPKGGDYRFEFMATPPTGLVPEVLTPISATYLFTSIPRGIQKVTIIASSNEMEEPIGVTPKSFEPEELQDLLECTGVSGTGSFEEALHNAKQGLLKLRGGLYVRGEVVAVQFVMGGTVGENTVSVTVRGY